MCAKARQTLTPGASHALVLLLPQPFLHCDGLLLAGCFSRVFAMDLLLTPPLALYAADRPPAEGL